MIGHLEAPCLNGDAAPEGGSRSGSVVMNSRWGRAGSEGPGGGRIGGNRARGRPQAPRLRRAAIRYTGRPCEANCRGSTPREAMEFAAPRHPGTVAGWDAPPVSRFARRPGLEITPSLRDQAGMPCLTNGTPHRAANEGIPGAAYQARAAKNRRTRASPFSIRSPEAVKLKRRWPSWPNAEPGTVATCSAVKEKRPQAQANPHREASAGKGPGTDRNHRRELRSGSREYREAPRRIRSIRFRKVWLIQAKAAGSVRSAATARLLRNRAGVRGHLALKGRRRTNDRLRTDRPADPPTGHGEGLGGAAVDQQTVSEDVRHPPVRPPGGRIEDQMGVGVVPDKPAIGLERQFRNPFEISLAEGDAGGIAGNVQDDGAGAAGERGFDGPPIGAESGGFRCPGPERAWPPRSGRVRESSASRGVGDHHFVPLLAGGEQETHQCVLAPVGDEHIGKVEAKVEVAPVGVDDRLPQFGSAGNRCVSGLARFDRPNARLANALRRIEVRLPGGKIHDIHSGRPQGDGLRHDGEGGRPGDGRGAVGQAELRLGHGGTSGVGRVGNQETGGRSRAKRYPAGAGTENRSARHRATGSGTSPRMSPPSAAISLMSFELTYEYSSAGVRKTVSTSGASRRFMSAI